MRRNRDPDAAKTRRARQRKIRAKLKRLRKIRETIARLQTEQPKRWRPRVVHWKKVAGKVRRELRRLGWKPKKRSTDPMEETEEQATDEELSEPTTDPDEQDIPEEEEPEDGGEEGGNAAEGDDTGACECQHRNWIHGDGGPKPFAKIREAVANLAKGQWVKPVALGTQGKLRVRPGQRAMVIDVEPGLHIVQFVPDSMTNPVGDDVGVVPLLLLPGIAKGVRKVIEKVHDPMPGQPGHAQTPPIPRPASPAIDPDGAGGPRRGRRRRRPLPRRPKAQEEEEEDTSEGVRRRRRARRDRESE